MSGETQKTAEQLQAASLRKAFAHQLLLARLHLDEDWSDPEMPIDLPQTPPVAWTEAESRLKAAELSQYVLKLCNAGCRKDVIYWCLQQLTPVAEQRRRGVRSIMVTDPEDESSNFVRRQSHPIATREDMKAVAAKAKAAVHAIKKCEEEILWAADAQRASVPLPSGLFTPAPLLPEEALDVLVASLRWIQSLAGNWQAPNEASLVKSKGILYLLVYMWRRAMSEGGESLSHRRFRQSKTPCRLDRPLVDAAALLLNLCFDIDFSAADLNDKLQDFFTAEPELFDQMADLLSTLHRRAEQANPTT